jgi:PAS domain S-box-containing protein
MVELALTEAYFEASPDGVVVTDGESVIVLVNARAEALFGYPRAELIGRTVDTLVPGRFAGGHAKFRQEFVAHPHSRPMGAGQILFGRRKDGSEVPVDISLSPFTAAGKLLVICSVRDASSRVRAETELREALERSEIAAAELRTFVESAPDGIVVADRDGRIFRVNRQTEKLFGYGRDELIGQPVEMLIPQRLAGGHGELRRGYFVAPLIRPMGNGRELLARRKDGSEFSADVSLAPLETPEGMQAIATVRDATERRRAEQRVHEQLGRLSLLHQITRAIGERQDLKSIFRVTLGDIEKNLPLDFAAICTYDAIDYRLTVDTVSAGSQPLAEALGLTEGAALEIDSNGLSRGIRGELVHEPDTATVGLPFSTRVAQAGLRTLVIAPLAVESKILGVLIACRREARSLSSVECEFLRQLSEHVTLAAQSAQLHDALQRAYDDLRQTQQAVMQQERLRALGQMASGIAHDINNAISPASLYIESLLEHESGLSERGRGHLATIARAIEDVAQTVSGMREFYRQREPQLLLLPVQFNRLVQQVVDLTRPRWSDQPQKRGRVIELRTDLAHELPLVMGIESELREALTNLIFNAVDAMPEGGVLTLRSRMMIWGERAGATPTHCVIEVVDTGIGMDEDTRRRCLEPFFTTKGERGTGLGLAMVYGVMERHSAEIEIDSEPGKGTTVRLVFTVPRTTIGESKRPAISAADMPSLNLLIVDDDPMLCRSLRDALVSEGHRVTTADSGHSGIELFRDACERSAPYDVVITDLGMPHVDGRAVARAVKQASPATPVIMLTGWGMRMSENGEVPAHVDRILGKPPKVRELREALYAVTRGKGTAG